MNANWSCPCGCEHLGLSDEMLRTCADYPRCHEVEPSTPKPPYVRGSYREIFGVDFHDLCSVCGATRGELARTYVNGLGDSWEERGGCNHR